MKILFAVIAALICACTGAFVLWQFHTGGGLVGGVLLVLLGVAIALPTPFTAGVATLKAGLVVIVPVVVDALKSGAKKSDGASDPPAGGAP